MRPRVRLLAVAGVALVSLGALAASGLDENLVYYRTPTELVEQPVPSDAVLRVGGMVVDDSVRHTPGGLRFTLTDGVTEVDVLHTGDVRGVFQEGQGALAEGSLGSDGVFRSTKVMVQHDNTYRALEQAADGGAGGGTAGGGAGAGKAAGGTP